MACAEFAIAGVSSEKMQHILTELQNAGITVEGDGPWSMQISTPVAVSMNGRHSDDTLFITVTDKPFFLTCKKIKREIEDMIDDVLNPMVV